MPHKYFVNEGLGMIVCHSQNESMGKREERESGLQTFHCSYVSQRPDLEACVVSP